MKIEFQFQPKQKLFAKTVESTPVTLYGGAKGGGKSKGLRDIMILRRLKYAGSEGVIFRRSYPELEGNHIRPLFRDYPQLRDYYNEGKKIINFPNGSTLQFCHCQSENDVTLYQGREFHDLGIEEAGQWTESMFQTLRGSNRSSKKGIQARTLLTANPGGIGHSWLKRLFIEKNYNPREVASDYAFIQALVDDNPALVANDPDYVRRLEAEPNEVLRKAYRYGSWDIFAGQFFSEIRREVHVLKAFNIPPHWNKFGAYDFGYNHPAAFGWFAVDEDGVVYLYRELVQANLRVDEFARKILEFSDTKDLTHIVAGHDCWVTKNVMDKSHPPTIWEEFLKYELSLTKATIERINGASRVRQYLAWQNKVPNKPRFYILDTCPISFECLNRMQMDPKDLEDVLKQDASNGDPYTGDDAYDMIRYGLMTRPAISETPFNHPMGSPEWNKREQERMFQTEVERFKGDESDKDEFSFEWG